MTDLDIVELTAETRLPPPPPSITSSICRCLCTGGGAVADDDDDVGVHERRQFAGALVKFN